MSDSIAEGPTRQESTGREVAAAHSISNGHATLLLVLTSLFVTSLVTAQLVSAKLAVLALPILGAVSYPTGTLAYAGTFFATDVTGELFGKEVARRLVNVGFAMNVVLLGFAWAAIQAPHAPGGVDQAPFAAVIGASTNVVLGSLVAYVIAQNWDVVAFHWLGRLTDGDHLWLRNVGSTGTSQLVDTVLFTTIAFRLAPEFLGVGFALSDGMLVATIVGQYVLKLGIALVDTPLVYATVGLVRRRTDASAPAEARGPTH